MSYVQGTDFIADTEECRRLARNVVTADFDDAQIESYQYKHYSTIRTLTDKDDWDSGDREFGSLQLIEIELTAASIIKHFGDVETIPIWQNMKLSAMDDLREIIKNMDTETPSEAIDFLIDRTEFKGWGLNSSQSPPDRLGSGSASNTEGF